MKKANKVILMSVLTVIACVSLITGATFALFTSESDVNIAVTSGKVDVQASISDVVMKSELAGSKGDYAALGTYTLDGSKLTVSNIAPGDYVTFKITIVNRSTVATKWQLQLVTDNSGVELFDLLSIQVEGMAGLSMVDTGKGEMSNWEALAPVASGSSQQVGELTVTIAMPTSETAQVEGECVISAKVVAIQGNAETVDPEEVDRTDLNKVYIYDLEDFEAFRDAAETDNFARKTVYLMENIDLGGKEWKPIKEFSGTFEGNGQVISNLKINQPEQDGVGLFAKLSGATINKLVISGVDIAGRSAVGAIAGSAYTGTITDCQVKGLISIKGNYQVGGIGGGQSYVKYSGCSVDGASGSKIEGVYSASGLEGDAIGGIVGYNAEDGNRVLSDCSVNNVEVAGTRKVGGIVGQLGAGADVSGCSFTNGKVTCNASADYASANAGKLFIGGIVGEQTTTADSVGYGVSELTNNRVENSILYAQEKHTQPGVDPVIIGGTRYQWTYVKVDASNTVTNSKVMLGDIWVLGHNLYGADSPETLVAYAAATHDGKITSDETNYAQLKIMADIDMLGYELDPIVVNHGRIDGNSHTIGNLKIKTSKHAALMEGSGNVVSNLTINGFEAEGSQVAVFLANGQGGYGVGVKDCTLKGDIELTYKGELGESYPSAGVLMGVYQGEAGFENVTIDKSCTVAIHLNGFTPSKGAQQSNDLLFGYIADGSVSQDLYDQVTVNGVIKIYLDGAPTKIFNEQDLIAFRDAVNGGQKYVDYTVRLMDDVELLQHWTPIGTETNYFGGTFDGQGHTISGLDLTSTDQFVTIGSMGSMTWGLFGCTGQSNGGTYSSMVKNIKLTGNIDLDIPSSSTMYMVGLVCGSEGRDFENIWMDFNCKISGSLAMFAPIYSCANVKECIVTGTYDIESVSFAASLIAGQAAQSMDKCVFAGTMSIQSELPLYTELGLATLGCPSVTSSYFADCSAAGVVVKGTLTKELFENAFADTDWEWNEELSQPQWKQ